MANQNIINSAAPILGIDSWNHAVNQTFCPLNCSPGASRGKKVASEQFRGELHNTALNRIQLARISSNAVTVDRSTQDIAQVSDAFYLAKFQIQGESVVRQRGRKAHLKPGDFVICSSSEPYRLHMPDNYYQAVLSIPQPLLQEMFHCPDDYLGVKMDSQLPTHGLLSQFVVSMIQRMDELAPAIVQRLEANVLDLLITSLHAEDSAKPKKEIGCTEQHLHRIRQFIAMHLKDPDLSPDYIAQAENISTRYLHMLFKPEGTSVSRYIQQHRLEACHDTLINPNMQHLSTAEIALDCGFGDISHFHRCFKARYQTTPRQLRVQAKN